MSSAPSLAAPSHASPGQIHHGFASRLFASGMLAFVLIGTLPSLYGVALPVWTLRFGLEAGQGGTLLAAHGAGALLTVAGSLFGLPFLTLRTGLVLLALGAACLAPEASWTLALGAAFIAGSGFGIIVTVVNRRFLWEFGPKGPGMLGLVNAVTGIGAVAAPLLVLGTGGQPGVVLWGIAVLALLVLPFTTPEAARGSRPGRPDLPMRRAWVLAFVPGTIVCEVAMTGWGASALIDLGLGDASAARLTSGFFATFLLARLALYWLTRWLASDTLTLIGLAGTAAAAALAAAGLPGLGYIVAGAFVGVTFPALYVWAVGFLGGDPRMGSAVLTASLTGIALGPLGLRPILGRTGEDGMFWIVALLAAGLALAFAAAMLVLRGRVRAA